MSNSSQPPVIQTPGNLTYLSWPPGADRRTDTHILTQTCLDIDQNIKNMNKSKLELVCYNDQSKALMSGHFCNIHLAKKRQRKWEQQSPLLDSSSAASHYLQSFPDISQSLVLGRKFQSFQQAQQDVVDRGLADRGNRLAHQCWWQLSWHCGEALNLNINILHHNYEHL